MIKNKNGFITLEFIIVSSVLIPLMISFMGIFMYSYPTFSIQRDVNVLIRQIQQHGGVRSEDLANFENSIQRMTFVHNSNKNIEVSAKTHPEKYNAMNVTDLNYISKKDNTIINLIIKVPSNNSLIKKFTKNYNEYYIFESNIISEKY